MMRRSSILLALVLGATLLSSPAGAETSFTFHGSGWGHGIGLSQYGSLGLAQDGWGANKILRHYYSGAKIESRTPPATPFRIGLLQSRGKFTFNAARGAYRLILEGSGRVARVRAGGTRVVTIEGGKYRIAKPGKAGKVVGGNGKVLRVKREKGSVVSVSEWGHSVGRGRLEIVPTTSSRAHLVALLGPQAYLFGLAEVPSSWPVAALRSQAIAGRTYAYRKIADNPTQRRSECACGLLASTRDQYYAGWSKESGPSGQRWVSAVKDTKDRVATYGGKLISTYYSSSSGGFTENIENVWLGSSPAPYLKGVCDPGDWVSANGNRTWSVSLSDSAVTSKLKGLTGNIGTVTGFSSYSLGVSGRVRTVKVTGTSGSAVVKGWDMRSALGLKDTKFRVGQNRNITGKIRGAYDDLMCAPGRATGSQSAVDGGRVQTFQVGLMYLNSAPNVVVWLRGPVLEEYLKLGGHDSALGLPLGLEESGGGWTGTFDGGTITCPSGGSCTVGYA